MQVARGIGQTSPRKGVPEFQGIVGWLLNFVQSKRTRRYGQQRLMQVVETLSLGGKRQLILVSCGGEHFLVGGGFESVEAIVRLERGLSVENQDEICR